MNRGDDRLAEYALGELTPGEAAEAEAYLERSPSARAEVVALRESLVVLADALPPAAPPENGWAKLRARLDAEAAPTGSRAAPRPARARARRPRPVRPPRWLAAAGLALAAVAGLSWGYQSDTARRAAVAEAELVAAFLAEPEVRRVPLRGPGRRPIGSVLVRPDRRALVVLIGQPGRGEAYQAWGHAGESWAPGGRGRLVSLALSRDGTFEVDGGRFAALYLSLEPERGSDQPTAPLARVPLRSSAPAASLTISRPGDGAVLAADRVVVSGTAGDGAARVSYALNGTSVGEVPVAGGRFAFTVSGLRRGENTVVVSAVGDGVTVTEAITVTYAPGTAGP